MTEHDLVDSVREYLMTILMFKNIAEIHRMNNYEYRKYYLSDELASKLGVSNITNSIRVMEEKADDLYDIILLQINDFQSDRDYVVNLLHSPHTSYDDVSVFLAKFNRPGISPDLQS